MKIIYISADYYPPVRAAAIRAQFNVSALREAGFEVLVLTCKSGHELDVGVITVSQPPPSNSLSLIPRLVYELKLGCLLAFAFGRNYSKGDLLVFSTPPFFAMSICVLASICMRLNYVLDVRDRYPKVFCSLGLLSRASIFFRLLEWWEKVIYRKAAAVTTVTNTLGEEFFLTTGIKPAVVRNGFDESLFHPGIEESVRDRVIIVTHGVFGKFFDIDTFSRIAFQCAENAPDHEFLLIGYGPKLEQLKAMRLPNIRIIGQTSQQDIAKILAQSHIGLSLHRDDESMQAAFPVKIFEFIGAGLPMLVMPKSEAGLEIESSGMGWCFSSSQIDAAGCKLCELINSREIRNQCKSNVINKRDNYSRQKSAKSFADVLNSIQS